MTTGPVRPIIEGVEGETFLDETPKPIPPRHTWGELTLNELYDVHAQLEQKSWEFAKNPVISKGLREGLTHLKALIASQASS